MSNRVDRALSNLARIAAALEDIAAALWRKSRPEGEKSTEAPRRSKRGISLATAAERAPGEVDDLAVARARKLEHRARGANR